MAACRCYSRPLHPLPNLVDHSMQRIIPQVGVAFGSPHLSMTQGFPDQLQTSPGFSSENGLKFVFPAKLDAPECGIPTGFSAPMLQGLIISPSQDVYI